MIDEIGRETARILAELIRLDTVNPPGNEILVTEYLAGLLDREGIRHVRLAKRNGRDNLVARYHGTGDKLPILLHSHSDVVPADVGWGVWSVEPFSGEVSDGVLYGRGAVDAKGLVAVQIAVLLMLKRNNVVLDRDLIVAVVAGEETGGGYGMGWLLEEHRELIEAEVALGEGGRVMARGDTVWSAWVQAGEKSAHNLKVTAVGESGHASIPSSRNAIERLVRSLTRIEEYTFEEKINPVAAEFIRRIQPYDSSLRPGGARYNAVTRNTVSVTLIEGGIKTNVIPDFAGANLNLRLLPGENLEEVTRELEEATCEEGVTIEHKLGAENGSSIQSFQTPFFETIANAAKRRWPNIVVAPYLSPGTTDNSKLRRAGILTYGLMPFPLTADESSRVHGIDEQVRLKALAEGVHFLYDIVLDWGNARPVEE